MPDGRRGDEPETPGAFLGLPDAVVALVPELVRLPVATEPLSDCSDCVMAPARMGVGAEEFAFNPAVRCCTYHPDLPNYLIGRALGRGGKSADVIRARLQILDAVGPHGIEPDAEYKSRDARAPHGFGTDEGMRCPFWVGGDHACGIWLDRNAVCRTWFCRHAHGRHSQLRWINLRETVRLVESVLASHCVEAGEPPAADASPQQWEAWFVRCAVLVDDLTEAELADIASSAGVELKSLREEVAYRIEMAPPRLPDIVVAEVNHLVGDSDGLAVSGYTRHDIVPCSIDLLDFIDVLDGQRPWQDAAKAAGITTDAIAELHRIGVLQEPCAELADTPPAPALLAPSFRRPIVVGDRVVLRGEAGFGCVVAPSSIFALIAKLDGERPWRVALEELAAEGGKHVAPDLVQRLFRIRALVVPD